MSEYDFPEQERDISYGLYNNQIRYFGFPTPGGPNIDGYLGMVADTKFSQDRGFYESSFDVVITCETGDAVIRYALDGSEPTETDPCFTTTPITIDGTTCLRAKAFKPGWLPSNSDTQTYIFLDNVLTQTRPSGYPMSVDYDMDPDVVTDPRYSDETMKSALLAIPTLSIVMDVDDIFGSNGVWLNGGQAGGNAAYERPGSLELIYPNGQYLGFQINCGFQPHGNIGVKHSMDVLFKAMYGPTKLQYPFFESAPLHADSATDRYDKLVFLASSQSWADFNEGYLTYTRDIWGYSTQIALSGTGPHSSFYHLYINGLYFGLWYPAEECDHRYTSANFGGEEEDWFTVKALIERYPNEIISGDRNRMDEMVARAEARDLEDPNKFNEFQTFFDIDKYIDYLILHWYNGVGDMYDNNWFAGMRMVPEGQFMWFAWDIGFSWIPAGLGSWTEPDCSPYGGGWFPYYFEQSYMDSNPSDVAVSSRIGKCWRALMENDDFRMRFADRVYKHCFTTAP